MDSPHCAARPPVPSELIGLYNGLYDVLYNVLENHNRLGRAAEPGGPVKKARLWKSFVPVVVNLLLGIPAVVPIFLTWYFLSNGPLAELGWTQRDPNEDDGMLLWLIFVVPAVGCFGGIWALTNLWIRRKLFTEGPPSMYWSVSVVLVLAPYFLGLGFA
ncbi:hypothetical protein [Streptomyces cyaneofuscatus]|uniref:hypothetical protein n=1 Tax=Streptomyces cyaneofuscatus TaxID=66883 RepID=UPI00364B3079